MAEPKKQPDKVEACIANAIELLEEADSIDRLMIFRDDPETIRAVDRVVPVLDKMMGDAPAKHLAINQMRKKEFVAAHDLITRAALDQLVECSCGKSLSLVSQLRARLDELKDQAVDAENKALTNFHEARVSWGKGEEELGNNLQAAGELLQKESKVLMRNANLIVDQINQIEAGQ